MKRIAGVAAMTAAVFAISTGTAAANHSWGGYHWARTANPFVVALGSNVTEAWASGGYLAAVSSDWSQSTVLDTTVVGGAGLKRCGAVSGRVEVCNDRYGRNGWLGLASVWASGSHITKATVKLNDTYFGTSTYNTAQWRQSVMCQEVGHTFGLDHQSEDPNVDLDTCMDYYKVPNLHPNAHDYDELALIYGHLDATTTLAAKAGASAPRGNGLRRLRDDLYVEELGGGRQRFVWVYWKDHGPTHGAPAGA